MGECGKRDKDPRSAKAAQLLDRCPVCMRCPGAKGRCPIGPEWIGRGLNVVGYSIQAIRHEALPKDQRWVAVAFFSGRHIDRRYPVAYFRKRQSALVRAVEYGECLTGGPAEPCVDGSWRVGPPGHRIPIFVVP